MKYKTTDKEQRNNNTLVIDFGHCTIQNITQYINANAYTAGIYGWRADFYDCGSYTISTGYAPLKYIRYKAEAKRYDYIKREILKLEKKLEKCAYKFQQSNDWDKGRAFVNKYLKNLYIKAAAYYGE